MRSYQKTTGNLAELASQFPFQKVPYPTPQTVVIGIALEQLTFSPERRRKMNPQSIQALAARIHAGTQIQSLIVVPGEEGQYYVVAGERRLAALQLLLKQGKISAAYLVACRLVNAEPTDSTLVLAEEASTSYSVDHEKRRRFKDLRNRCSGLITGTELAIRELARPGSTRPKFW
jgi:ParB/Sulfiredoxin domain